MTWVQDDHSGNELGLLTVLLSVRSNVDNALHVAGRAFSLRGLNGSVKVAHRFCDGFADILNRLSADSSPLAF
jgi:hypothetical protein